MTFVKPEVFSGHLFEFSDFIAALAILIVILTMTDIRYRFRVSVAPFPILGVTYFVAFVVGILLLTSQFFYSLGWRFPDFLANQLKLEFWLGLAFFLSIFLWISYAFIKRLSVFTRLNSKRFYYQVERSILRGLDSDLPVIADELARSSKSLVKLSMLQQKAFSEAAQKQNKKWTWIKSEEYAYRLLFIMSNKKFCRHVASTSPWTAISIFSQMREQEKYDLPVNEFAINLFSEALINTDSFLYHENASGNSGLIGGYRPLTDSLFSDYDLITALTARGRSQLDVDYRLRWEWNSRQFQIYCSCLLVFSKSFFNKISKCQVLIHSFAYCRGLEIIKESCDDLYKINNVPDYFNSEPYRRVNEAVGFIRDTFELLDAQQKFPVANLRKSTERLGDVYDHLSNLMFDIIFAASYIKEPFDTCWDIQRGLIFNTFFLGLGHQSIPVKIIRHRLRRKLFDEIKNLSKLPNYKSARILRYCLSVQGLRIHKPQSSEKNSYFYYQLQQAVLSWVRSNFLKLYASYPEIANYCLPIQITLDSGNNRLVETFSQRLNGTKPQFYFDLAP